MDNQRLLVWATFGLLAFLTWEAWMQDYGPQPEPQAEERAEPADALPDAPAAGTEDMPSLADAPPAASDNLDATPADAADAVPETPGEEPAAGRVIRVLTDVFALEISTRGGTVVRADLLEYPVDKERPDEPVTLLARNRSNYGLLQTGLLGEATDRPAPDQTATFSAARDEYRLEGDELVVPLTWSDGAGVSLTKRFTFRRGRYDIEVEQTLVNESAEPWRGGQYAQLVRRSYPPDRSMFDVESYSFDGPIVYNGEKSTKLQRDDLAEDGAFEMSVSRGWVATIQHHFLEAIVPPQEQAFAYRVALGNNVVRASAVGQKETIEAGGEFTFSNTLFVGPKLQDQLEDVAASLKLTVDYGWLTILSEPLFWLLALVHDWVQNWGLAIIIVTILIKLAFYKLTEASGRSMAKMRKLQPRMKALQERYKDDRQQLSQQMMELYKREKVNPAAGCLPILIQMPFFLAFYWVLLESVEMRQAPFAGWITDLSSRDPYFILPLIMGAAMLFQQKLNPAPTDPVQARVMQIMPVVFTAFFAFFPSGLVLYWVTNTVLSIAQQWRINKVVEQEDRRKGGGGKARKKNDKADKDE